MSAKQPTAAFPLTTNGLVMPADFPSAGYEDLHKRVAQLHFKTGYEHFAGAWNGISYRFNALADYDEAFTQSISAHGPAPDPAERYRQERDLFGFFSNGFSTFESFFYGAFALGALLQPGQFALVTPSDQQQVSPRRTIAAYERAFSGAPVIGRFQALVANPGYIELREIRNVLTHRSAPGRTIHLSVGSDETPPGQWKLANISLDKSTTGDRRQNVVGILSEALAALQEFAEATITV